MTKGLHKNSLRKVDNPHQWMIDDARMELIQQIKAEIERQREEIRPTDTGEMKVVGTPTQLEQGWLNALSWMELESYAQKVEDHYDVGEERGYLCVHRGGVKDAVIAGADWQKEQMMKSPLVSVGYTASEELQRINYENGRKDMREQMMKEAVEGIAVINANAKEDGFGYVRSDYVSDDVLRGLGRFKIIIVKED